MNCFCLGPRSRIYEDIDILAAVQSSGFGPETSGWGLGSFEQFWVGILRLVSGIPIQDFWIIIWDCINLGMIFSRGSQSMGFPKILIRKNATTKRSSWTVEVRHPGGSWRSLWRSLHTSWVCWICFVNVRHFTRFGNFLPTNSHFGEIHSASVIIQTWS